MNQRETVASWYRFWRVQGLSNVQIRAWRLAQYPGRLPR